MNDHSFKNCYFWHQPCFVLYIRCTTCVSEPIGLQNFSFVCLCIFTIRRWHFHMQLFRECHWNRQSRNKSKDGKLESLQYRPSAMLHLHASEHFLALEQSLIKRVWHPFHLQVFTILKIFKRIGCHAPLIGDYLMLHLSGTMCICPTPGPHTAVSRSEQLSIESNTCNMDILHVSI